MIDRRLSMLFGALLLSLICFDAFQQKYYLEAFELANEPVTLGSLLVSHFIRWVTWLVVTLPFGYIIWRRFYQGEKEDLFKIILSAILSMLLAVALISVISILRQDLPISEHWQEFFVFFFYQKGLIFLMAFAIMFFWIKNEFQRKEIDTQWLEISNLKKESEALTEALTDRDAVPHINVKTKNHVKPIPIEDIVWIQADDYCVKVHTHDQSFYLRKSMKFLEKELGRYGFLRVHRGALLNLNFLDQVNFENASIRLTDHSELPLSKSGGALLKRRMQEQAI